MRSRFLCFIPMLLLPACGPSSGNGAPASDAELQRRLVGTWRADAQLTDGTRVESETRVDAAGNYVFFLTNSLADDVRASRGSGVWQVRAGLLTDTITNDGGGGGILPRTLPSEQILRLDEHELVVASTNNGTVGTYRKGRE